MPLKTKADYVERCTHLRERVVRLETQLADAKERHEKLRDRYRHVNQAARHYRRRRDMLLGFVEAVRPDAGEVKDELVDRNTGHHAPGFTPLDHFLARMKEEVGGYVDTHDGVHHLKASEDLPW